MKEENMIKKIEKLKRKEIVITAIITYILTYGIVFNQVIINNDSIRRIIGEEPSRLASGRFITDIYYNFVHGGIISPVVSFFLGGLFLITGSYFLIKTLKVSKKYQELLIYFLVITYPIFDFFNAYGPDFDLYCLAFLTSVLSIYFLMKKNKKSIAISLMFIIFTLGIYQAFLVIITGLLFLVNIIKYIEEKELKAKELLFEVIVISIGMILYYIFLNIILFITGTELASYRGANSLSIIDMLKNIPHNIIYSYKEFIQILTKNSLLFNTNYDHLVINLFLWLFLVIFFIVFILKNFKKDIPLLILLLILFVPSLYSINFIVQGFYDYIMFGYLIYLILIVYLIDKVKIKNIILSVMLLFVFFNFVKINQYNLQTKLLTDTSFKISSQIAYDLFEQEDYTSESPVIILGQLRYNDAVEMTEKKPYDINNKFLYDTFPGFNKGLKVYQLIEAQGYNINYDSKITYDKEKFENSPSYPKEGYIYEEEGNYIIKLGDLDQ